MGCAREVAVGLCTASRTSYVIAYTRKEALVGGCMLAWWEGLYS